MLNPTPAQILRNIEFTLADIVEPAVTTTTARSALATIGHLLRHVVLRIEEGGEILAQDIGAARSLLTELQTYCQGAGDTAQVQMIANALSGTAAIGEQFLSGDELVRRSTVLRQSIQDILVHLQDQRASRMGDKGYQDARAAIRSYLSEQLAAEARLIHPAFADKGPRR